MNNDTSFDITKESNPVQTVAPTNKEDNEMLRATEKITALYCRLSVEDTKDEKKNCRTSLYVLLIAPTRTSAAVIISVPLCLNKSYTQEQKDLKAEVISLQQVIEEQERQAENLEQFIQRVKRNSELTELTPYALRELVKTVYVEAPDKSSGKRKQKIHISYDLIGFIPVDVLTKAEQA